MWLNYYACVGVCSDSSQSSISSDLSSATVSDTVTITISTTSSAIQSSGSCIPVSPPGPTQDGIFSQCTTYHQVVSGDSCPSIATGAGITTDQLKALNPAFGDQCTNMWLNYYACVGACSYPSQASSSSVSISSVAASPTSSSSCVLVSAPGPTQAGISTQCSTYHQVVSGDSCPSIASDAGITVDQLGLLNPSFGDQCTNMWLNYYACVGACLDPWPASSLSAPVPSTTTDPSTCVPVSAAGTTHGDPTTLCSTWYYVQSGDACTIIASKYGTTLDQLVALNPGLGSDCSGLWADTYICVAACSSS